jgi:hypothetical protein
VGSRLRIGTYHVTEEFLLPLQLFKTYGCLTVFNEIKDKRLNTNAIFTFNPGVVSSCLNLVYT